MLWTLLAALLSDHVWHFRTIKQKAPLHKATDIKSNKYVKYNKECSQSWNAALI